MALSDKPSHIKTKCVPDEIYDGIIAVLQGKKKVVGKTSKLSVQDRSIKEKSSLYILDETLRYV
jgi:hypothetical protein